MGGLLHLSLGGQSLDGMIAGDRTAPNILGNVRVFQIVKLSLPQYHGEVMNKPSAVAALLASALLPLSLFAQSPSLTVQVDHPTAAVSPTLYGLMTEEINYSYDGGIYGELIRDRTPSQAWDALRLWPMVARGDSIVNVSTDDSDGLSKALARSLRVTVSKASSASPAGVENGGYWGIPVRPHTVYTGSFYAKTDATDIPVTVALQNDQTGVIAASATVTGVGGEW